MAPNSSSLALISKKKNGGELVKETIDERILRLLGLEDVFDIDYDTYESLLRERMAAARMTNQSLATEEVEMITDEWKRIKGKKGRFKVKKITATSFKKGSAVGINLRKKNLLKGVRPLALPPSIDKLSSKNDFDEIKNILNDIISILKNQNKLQKDISERERRDRESEKRAAAESRLEKGFAAAIKVAEKVLSPVKSLLSRIIDFFMAIFWGKVVLKIVDWLSKKENKKKIDSLFRFFNDHWPKLLALYLRFGTGLGRFVGGLTKLVFFGTRKLLQVVAQLVGAKGAARFLGGRGGQLVSAGLQVATTVGTTMALSGGIEKFVGKGESEKEPKVPNYFGGGFVNMFKGLKGFFGGGPGFVSGQKGVDKIPAMLSDGEFVMSRGAVEKYGVDTLEAMNASGGGTNKPRMLGGVGYAAGGGLFGNAPNSSNPFMGLLRSGPSIKIPNPFEWFSFQRRRKSDSKPKPFDAKGYASSLTSSAQQLLNEKWSYLPNPGVGCAPAINEVYKRSGLPLPWKGISNINYVPQIYKSLTKTFVRVPEKVRKPGDIVIWKDTGEPPGSGIDPYGHIGIVMPDGRIANNSTGSGSFSNLNTPSQAKSWWPNTKELIYFRHPRVNSSLMASSSRPRAATSTASSRPTNIGSRIMASVTMPLSRRADGGMVGGKVANISGNPVKPRNVSPPTKPPVIIRSIGDQKIQGGNNAKVGGSPRVPQFSSAYLSEERMRVLAIHAIA